MEMDLHCRLEYVRLLLHTPGHAALPKATPTNLLVDRDDQDLAKGVTAQWPTNVYPVVCLRYPNSEFRKRERTSTEYLPDLLAWLS